MTRPVALAVATLALSSVLVGCQRDEQAEVASYHPAELGDVTAAGVKPVTFTADAAEQVDLAVVPALPGGRFTLVPYAALIYDGQGTSWVYTNPSGTTYLRAKVTIDRVEGDTVYLTDGVRAGTRVVTVGASEVYGAELNIGGGH